MDNKTVAITVTASAVGVGLAYLGYNKYYDVNKDIEEIREEITGELNKKISRKEWLELNGVAPKIKSTAWSTFWSNEYKQANNDISTNDEVDAGSIPEIVEGMGEYNGGAELKFPEEKMLRDLTLVPSHTTEEVPSTVRVPSTD